MSPKANNTAEELLKLQTNAEEVHKDDSPLIEREDLKNTPFKIVGNKTVGYMLTIGQYNLSGFMDTKDQLQEWVEINTWFIVQRLIGSMIDFNERNKELPQETNQQK